MILSTLLNLFVVPVMYVLIINIEERLRPRHGKRPSDDDDVTLSGGRSVRAGV
jgi:hypothetical protein